MDAMQFQAETKLYALDYIVMQMTKANHKNGIIKH